MVSIVASSIWKAGACAFTSRVGASRRMPLSANAAVENRLVVFMVCSLGTQVRIRLEFALPNLKALVARGSATLAGGRIQPGIVEAAQIEQRLPLQPQLGRPLVTELCDNGRLSC